ncbi:MAG: long-chain fatty acid--CoA ligase [Acidobacteriota bacterium]
MITILSRLQDHAANQPQNVAYAAKVDGEWRTTSWVDFASQVRHTARVFLQLGLEPGETVGILSFNRPEWTVSCLAAMSAGGVPVGIYQTCAPNQVAYIAGHAASRILVVENLEQWHKVKQIYEELPALEHVIVMQDADVPQLEDASRLSVRGWSEVLEMDVDEASETRLEARMAALEGDQLAVLIYTSGTTGQPKGVMLTHSNLIDTARICDSLHGLGSKDSTLSYLPMAHIAEQMISIHLAIFSGYAVYYAEALEKLAANLTEVRPTIFFGVPRVWERIHASVLGKLETAPTVRRVLGKWALDVGRRAAARRLDGLRVSGLLAIQFSLAQKLVLSKVRSKLGMDRAQLCSSGAAPIRRDVLEFFASLGVVIYEVYGLSETCGPATWNYAGLTRLGTVGPVLPEVEVEIADDGEVLFRGPNVFSGYYKNPEATAEAMADGWFHTGDVGQLDAKGFLTITGRKKELIITSGGKNIAPTGIEAALKRIDLVGEAVVIGEARRFLSALLTLEEEAAARFAEERGIEGPLHDDEHLLVELQEGVDEVNAGLSRVESIRKFRVLPRSFSVEDEELTPTLKLRRQQIEANWRSEIEGMYEG